MISLGQWAFETAMELTTLTLHREHDLVEMRLAEIVGRTPGEIAFLITTLAGLTGATIDRAAPTMGVSTNELLQSLGLSIAVQSDGDDEGA